MQIQTDPLGLRLGFRVKTTGPEKEEEDPGGGERRAPTSSGAENAGQTGGGTRGGNPPRYQPEAPEGANPWAEVTQPALGSAGRRSRSLEVGLVAEEVRRLMASPSREPQ